MCTSVSQIAFSGPPALKSLEVIVRIPDSRPIESLQETDMGIAFLMKSLGNFLCTWENKDYLFFWGGALFILNHCFTLESSGELLKILWLRPYPRNSHLVWYQYGFKSVPGNSKV